MNLIDLVLKVSLIIVALLLAAVLVKIFEILVTLKTHALQIIKLITHINEIAEPVKDAFKKPVGQLVLNIFAIAKKILREERS